MMAQMDSSIHKRASIDSSHYSIAGNIYLDSIVISAVRSGFDIDDFIQIIREDNSFYQAFHRLRSLSYDFDHSIYFFNKKNSIFASYKGLHHQSYKKSCRSMQIIHKQVTGKYYKRKEFRFYTSKLFSKLFYTKDTICNSYNAQLISKNSKSNEQKQISRLKTLIFNPGESVNVPLIGDKLAIFSGKMIDYYDMSIEYENYLDSIPCFVFKIKLKDKYKNQPKKTVIKYLYTYIGKKNNQIIARKYQLAYKNFLYDFDVTMDIQLQQLHNEYVPMYIKYDGNWHIFTKKREKSIFEVYFKY